MSNIIGSKGHQYFNNCSVGEHYIDVINHALILETSIRSKTTTGELGHLQFINITTSHSRLVQKKSLKKPMIVLYS